MACRTEFTELTEFNITAIINTKERYAYIIYFYFADKFWINI